MNRVRPYTSARRHKRPSVRRLALEYHASLDALIEAFSEYEGLAPHSAEWCALLIRIKAQSDRVSALADRLFRAGGYSVELWRQLKRRA